MADLKKKKLDKSADYILDYDLSFHILQIFATLYFSLPKILITSKSYHLQPGISKLNWATSAVLLYLKPLCNHSPLHKPFYCSLAKVSVHLNTHACHLRFSPSLLNTAALNLPFHSSGGHSGLRLPLWLIHCAECMLAHLDIEINHFLIMWPFLLNISPRSLLKSQRGEKKEKNSTVNLSDLEPQQAPKGYV